MAPPDALAASLQEKSLQYQPIKVYLDSYQVVQKCQWNFLSNHVNDP